MQQRRRLHSVTTGVLIVVLTVGLLPLAATPAAADHPTGSCQLHDLTAARGPGRGEVTVAWSLPDTTNVQNVVIYRDGVRIAPDPVDALEVGSVELVNSIDGGAVETVSLSTSFDDPVVVAYGATRGGNESADVRVKNVTSTSFDVFIEEPDDGAHAAETVNYIVAESGVHGSLDQSLIVEAGTVQNETVHRSPDPFVGEQVDFAHDFSQAPAVLSTLNSYNNGEFMSTTVFDVNATKFNVTQEAGQSGSANVTETIGWIALSTAGAPGLIDEESVNFTSGLIAADGDLDGVDDTPETISYEFADAPALVVQGATGNGGDGYWARGAGTFNNTTATVFAEEDQVGDTERTHADEAFSFAALDAVGVVTMVEMPLPWEEGPAPYDLHFVDSGLPDGASFDYTIEPVCVEKRGPIGGPVLGGTWSVPDAPHDLRAGNELPHVDRKGGLNFEVHNTIGEARLTWQAPEDSGGPPILAYEILRSTKTDDNFGKIATVPGDQTTFHDEDASPTFKYYYKVRAVNVIGDGPTSNQACQAPSPWADPVDHPLRPCVPRNIV